MRAEVAPLLERLQVTRRERDGECQMVAGSLFGTPVVLAWTGEGAKLAESGARALLARFAVERMLIVGVAGGLSPELGAGCLVLASRIVDPLGPAPQPDEAWLATGLGLGEARAATVLTSGRILCSSESKHLARTRLRDDAPAVVDLESAAYARVAGEHGLAFLVVRAVSDTADEELPFDLNRCIDESGRVSRSRVVRQALLQPAAMRSLWGLRRRVGDCARSLAGFTERLLAAEAAR